MPDELKHMELMDTAAASSGVPPAEPSGKQGAIPLDSVDALKENLKAFTDSVHQKGSQVIAWIQAVEALQTEASKRHLGSIFFGNGSHSSPS